LSLISKFPINDKGFTIRYIALAAVLIALILIVMGGVVRVTETGGSCADWPACLGGWNVPWGELTITDYGHRVMTALVFLIVLSGSIWAKFYHREDKWISRPFNISLGLLIFQSLIGRSYIYPFRYLDQHWITALHLTISLLIFALLIISTVIAFYRSKGVTRQFSINLKAPFKRHTLLLLLTFFTVIISGLVVSSTQSGTLCSAWPLCEDGLIPSNPLAWISIAHRMIVAIVSILFIVYLLNVWRTRNSDTTLLVATTTAFVLYLAQALLGSILVDGFPIYLIAIHQATAIAVWGTLIVVVAAVGMSEDETNVARTQYVANPKRFQIFKDLLSLTKPIVVVLLLVTTYAGMVIGSEAFPPIKLTFWTLLGGFMAAGGSGAINQYIDRSDDLKMQRTQKRPIPAGRLTPGQGLAFGVGMAVASFYVMVAFVNLLAAILSLAGIIYYVLIYSILLKKTTVQNIVIGGGAGAIPPLVGWAAATGSLNVPSLFLFAIVFMWTPPHFWALALVRRKDYARAGVPMMPVVRGEKETRWQIMLYTIELVGLSLFLPLFGLGGSIYLIGALVLGGWLLLAAWKVWKIGGNKSAWKMYRYSSMYLAFIFMVLMVDVLV
jgi:protoheme IX farnesyltransferase